MTTIYFLRHGLTQENKEGRIQGHLPGNVLLHDTERYLAGITPLLRKREPQVIISSDLERAAKTREVLKKFLCLPNELEEGEWSLLREVSMGWCEGRVWAEVPAGVKENSGESDYDFTEYGGENKAMVRERVKKALLAMAQAYDGKAVVCVTHAGWLRELVDYIRHEEGLAEGWKRRSAIYEARVDPRGTVISFEPVDIKAYMKK